MFKLELKLSKYLEDFKSNLLNSWEDFCKRSTENLTDYELEKLYYQYMANFYTEDILLFLLLQSLCIFVVFMLLGAFFSSITGVEFWIHLGLATWVVFLIIRIVVYVRARIIFTANRIRCRRKYFI